MHELLYWNRTHGYIWARLDKQHEIRVKRQKNGLYAASIVNTASERTVVETEIRDRTGTGWSFVKTAAPGILKRKASSQGLPDMEKALSRRIPEGNTPTGSVSLKKALCLTGLWNMPDSIVKLSGYGSEGRDAAILSVSKIRRTIDTKHTRVVRIRPWLSCNGAYEGIWLDCACMPAVPL